MNLKNCIIDEQSLVSALKHHYSLNNPINCEFIRRSFNDHYVVESRDERFVLRVYINDKSYIHSINDLYFELDLLDYLYSQKLPVIAPIRNKDNMTLSLLKLENETRKLALFPYAKGNQINGNITSTQSIKLGQIIGKIHISSNGFQNDYSRYSLDIERLIKEPLDIIEKYMTFFDSGNISILKNCSKVLIAFINKIAVNDETFGIIHGDPNPSNFFYSKQYGFSLFDFDHCSFGYRIHDLSVIKLSFPADVYKSALSGYESIRQLHNSEKYSIDVYSDVLLLKKFSDIFNMLEVTAAGEDQKKEITQHALTTLNEIAGRYSLVS